MTYYFKNDIGLEIIVPISVSLSSAAAVYLDVKKPVSKTIISWVCASSGYDDTSIYYVTTTSSNGCFDEVGKWEIQPRVIWGTSSSEKLHGDFTFITINEPLVSS